MSRPVRRWHLVATTLFVGSFVVPVSLVLLRSASQLQSLATTAGAATGEPPAWVFAVRAATGLAVATATIGLAVAVYLDASSLADSEWSPDPLRYALPALLYPLSLAVGGWYLYRRYRTVGVGGFPLDGPLDRDAVADSRWWYHVAAGPFLAVAGLCAFLLPLDVSATFTGDLLLRAWALAVLSGTGIASFSVGLAADLALVRHSALDWTPGRRRYTLLPVLVPLLVPFVAAVYLTNRHRHVGVP